MYELKPTRARYSQTWDVNIVLDHLQAMEPSDNLDLQTLSRKTTMLIALSTAHRAQTIFLIDINNITRTPKALEIYIADRIKTSRRGGEQPCLHRLHLPYLEEKPKLCVASNVDCYLDRTKNIRETESRLFISAKKPHKAVGA